MRKLENKFHFLLVTVTVAATFLQSNVAFAERQKNTSTEDDSYKKALVSGWRFSVVTGHSPFCFGAQREFGHYRCGSYTDLTVAPQQSEGFILKFAGSSLRATRLLEEMQVNQFKAWDIEDVQISTLQLGRVMTMGRVKVGLSLGAGSGTITRSKAKEDEFYTIQNDEHKKITTISVYSASLLGSYVVAQTKFGDLILDLNQTWYATTEASHPRDERRVWANLPTLAAGWSYQVE